MYFLTKSSMIWLLTTWLQWPRLATKKHQARSPWTVSMKRRAAIDQWWYLFNDSTCDKNECRSGFLPKTGLIFTWDIEPESSRQKFIRNRAVSRSSGDGYSWWYCNDGYDQSMNSWSSHFLQADHGSGWSLTTVTSDKRDMEDTGYDKSQKRRPPTLECIGSISQRSYRAPTIRQK